jgi:hypothetical protein
MILSEVVQHERQNSQSRRKGADQRKITDLSAFLGNTAMGRDDVTKLSQPIGFRYG